MAQWLVSVFLIQYALSTVEIYKNVWSCTVPSLDRSYMGGPARAGTQLSLQIDDQNLEEFTGYKSSQKYKLKIKSVHDWNQYVIFVNKGTLKHQDDTKVGCDGKQIIVSELDEEVDMIWNPDEENENDTATITVAYAPHYTLVSIQTFDIHPLTIQSSNAENGKQEM